ncbi:hypothetical protein ACTQ1R_04145 [Prevotellaceae bacterium LCP21S3_C11]
MNKEEIKQEPNDGLIARILGGCFNCLDCHRNIAFWLETFYSISQYAYFPRSTATFIAIATKVAVRFGNFNINVYLCSAKTVAIATKVAVRIV